MTHNEYGIESLCTIIVFLELSEQRDVSIFLVRSQQRAVLNHKKSPTTLGELFKKGPTNFLEGKELWNASAHEDPGLNYLVYQ
jgi:hypothetical protein